MACRVRRLSGLQGLDEDEDLLEESYVEHDSAKVLIAELLDSESDVEFYEGKVTVLSETIKHHVKEEETRREGLFAPAKRGPVWIPIPWGGACRRQGGPDETVRRRQPAAAKTRSFTGRKLVQAEPVEWGRRLASGRCPGRSLGSCSFAQPSLGHTFRL
jgi:hypothetical protein